MYVQGTGHFVTVRGAPCPTESLPLVVFSTHLFEPEMRWFHCIVCLKAVYKTSGWLYVVSEAATVWRVVQQIYAVIERIVQRKSSADLWEVTEPVVRKHFASRFSMMNLRRVRHDQMFVGCSCRAASSTQLLTPRQFLSALMACLPLFG
jgi:hypothetical protein